MSRASKALIAAWNIAAAEAIEGQHPLIEPAHLLIGICSLEKLRRFAGREDLPEIAEFAADASVIAEVAELGAAFARHKIDAARLRRALRRSLGLGMSAPPVEKISRSTASRECFARAGELAGERDATVSDLLIVVVESGDPAVRAALSAAAIDFSDCVEDLRARESRVREPPDGGAPRANEAPAASCLDRFGRDLTELARRGAIGPVIGRRKEILSILQTMARSTKNNPVLVGEAGVGKTAIVEALAIRGAAGKDAEVLGGKRFVELSMGGLLAGTSHRGEFEERLTRILDEARAHPEVVVFIDELHTVVGAGRVGQGGMDAGDILKPALARGDLRLIGATTSEEYRLHIETDPALERRFERIDVEEPSREETIEILAGLCPRFEAHHGVDIDREALAAAVDLSLRFDADHRLPDKAIDLIDQAAAQRRVPMLSMRAPEGGESPAAEAGQRARVSALDVARVLADKRGLPLELLTDHVSEEHRPRILGLEPFLRSRLFGQDEAVTRVCRRLRLAMSGVSERRGPLSVFLFIGPTGVGKTEMARLLADFLFGHAEQMIRLDMSEYMEEHSIAKLIGAPPGYVGHDEGGPFVTALRGKPHAVVLLDEIDKAHPRVLDVFLQLFDEGRISDSHGHVADARSSIFAVTANLGPDKAALGYVPGRSDVDTREAARRFFRAELLNRIDDIVVFHALAEGDVVRILREMTDDLARRVAGRHNVRLRVDSEAERWLISKSYSPAMGAREVRRVVEQLVEAPLSTLLLDGKLARHASWRLAYDDGGVYWIPDEE